MQGSTKGMTLWLYADPKQKRDFLLRSRAKAHELYQLLLDTEAKEGVLAANAPAFSLFNVGKDNICRSSAARIAAIKAAKEKDSSAFSYTDPAILSLLQCVGSSTNLHKLFLSAQRWMYCADVVYRRLLSNRDMYAGVSKNHRRWVSAAVFPNGLIDTFALDINANVSVLMEHSVNPTAMQIPSPWLYVEREKTEASKVSEIVEGTQGEHNTDRMNKVKEGSGKRAELPEDSMLTRRLTKDQQLEFMQNLPYRMCATDDTGETTLGKYKKKPRRRGTSEQRASNTNAKRLEGMPLARDGSVTTASCHVCVDPLRMTPYECLHTISSTLAFVVHSLYFDGRAVSVTTTSRELATFLETIFGEFLDEQFLAVDLVESYDTLKLKVAERGTSSTVSKEDNEKAMAAALAEWLGGVSLAASSVWAVPDPKPSSPRSSQQWSAKVCESVLLQAAATDCRSIVVPSNWGGADQLQKTADELRERIERSAASSYVSSSSSPPPSSSSSLGFQSSASFRKPTVPSIYLSNTPVSRLLAETTRVPYLTLLSPDARLASGIALGSALGTGGEGTDSSLHESVKVVGVNSIAIDTPLFFPSAASPIVGKGWRSTTPHEPQAVLGNSHRFESVARSVVARPWESPIHGVKRYIASYDPASTPMAMVEPQPSAGLVSERLCGALASNFDAVSTAGLISAKVLSF